MKSISNFLVLMLLLTASTSWSASRFTACETYRAPIEKSEGGFGPSPYDIEVTKVEVVDETEIKGCVKTVSLSEVKKIKDVDVNMTVILNLSKIEDNGKCIYSAIDTGTHVSQIYINLLTCK